MNQLIRIKFRKHEKNKSNSLVMLKDIEIKIK